jgi:outer membrane immunogenic protein
MKRMLFAGALLLAAAGSTLAADLPPSMPPPPPPPRAPAYIPVIPIQYNWGGVYIGLNGGYGFGNSAWSSAATASGTGNFNINGPLVGGTLGANFQAGGFVFGVEGDGDWSNIKGSASATNVVCASCQTANTWLATLRARAGVAWDRVLIYGTGGGAAGTINTSGATAGITSSSNTEFGWAAGAGLEFAITDNITAKVEYLYVDLQNGSFNCPAVSCSGGPTAITGSASFETSLVRAGLNLKFNPF